MKELKDIVRAYDKAVREGQKSALATVVSVDGSSYRRPGARMLVTEDGQLTGAISGGCLEGDALRKAQLAMGQGHNKLVVYDTTDEDDFQFGVQLGCNGIVSILFEPFPEGTEAPAITLLRKATEARRNGLLLTGFDFRKNAPQPGTFALINASRTLCLSNNSLLPENSSALSEARKTTLQSVGDIQLLCQALPPPVHLVVAGAGNDVQPLVQMAALLGWEITVGDGRPAYAAAHRFPEADRVLVARADSLLDAVPVDSDTAFVLMTHNYNYDLQLLEKLLKTPAFYIGILGPQKKTLRMFEDLAKKGIVLTAAQKEKIFGPVGLDIGSEGSEEIALSVLAGVKAAYSHRSGAALKFRTGAINDRL